MKTLIYTAIFVIFTNNLLARQSKRLVWPSAPDPARIEYLSSITKSEDLGIEKGFFSKLSNFLFGNEEKVLSSPFGIYADKNRIYTTDIGTKKVCIFDTDKDETIWLEGSKNEAFMYPVDVVADKDGNIYVSDSVRAKIYVFNKSGDFLRTIQNKDILRPIGIALSPDEKKLYVVDALASKVHILDVEGKYLSSIGHKGGGPAEFNRPTYIDIGKDGKLYISDSMNHRIQVLDKEGKYLLSFGRLGENIGDFASPRGVALDSDGNIYVSDTMFNAIQIFNPKGQLLMKFSNYGGAEGELALPEDISITSDNKIYISDTNNMRIQIFKRLDVKDDGDAK